MVLTSAADRTDMGALDVPLASISIFSDMTWLKQRGINNIHYVTNYVSTFSTFHNTYRFMQLYRKLYSFVYDALVLLTIEQVLGLDNMTNYNIVK